uniref:Uncharacterized protein n=1 Tax=Timema bartmani TaxID=61472 RepID=A0A7R9I8K0_9NEOP|nr:unnamed protein product [Timema bartmani]
MFGVELHRDAHNIQGRPDDGSPSSNQNDRHEQFFTGEKMAAIDLADNKRKSHRDGKDGNVNNGRGKVREVSQSPSVSGESQKSLSQSTAAAENSDISDGDVFSSPKETIRRENIALISNRQRRRRRRRRYHPPRICGL